VANTVYYLLEKLSIADICGYSQLDKLILLLSGAAHDIDHPGNSNLFEINNRSILAFTYNDKSVLENYHLYVFFNLLSNSFLNVFENYDLNQVKNIRKVIISNIISTDMTFHKQEVKKLTDIIANPELDLQKQETKEYLMTHLIHFADISNPTKTFDVYNKWVGKIFAEFFIQVCRIYVIY
jgi:cAMP-specific phosphodiesterase 4